MRSWRTQALKISVLMVVWNRLTVSKELPKSAPIPFVGPKAALSFQKKQPGVFSISWVNPPSSIKIIAVPFFLCFSIFWQYTKRFSRSALGWLREFYKKHRVFLRIRKYPSDWPQTAVPARIDTCWVLLHVMFEGFHFFGPSHNAGYPHFKTLESFCKT